AVMAYDLGETPTTGLRVQACGDCHLMNFGAFASPERTLLFDINDFDETLPAPWEWDVKRLAASIAVAGRHLGGSDPACRGAVWRRVAPRPGGGRPRSPGKRFWKAGPPRFRSAARPPRPPPAAGRGWGRKAPRAPPPPPGVPLFQNLPPPKRKPRRIGDTPP